MKPQSAMSGDAGDLVRIEGARFRSPRLHRAGCPLVLYSRPIRPRPPGLTIK